ncbi:MAG TPA: hypothetical protein VGU03_09005 [Frateuria sp.]|uniref:hypothetical protein n=1 Tax=Frateuria sp. TaxID=2211372 RepID=UPI002DE9A08C|nr:hypothetical protein [Frateuria sp.]
MDAKIENLRVSKSYATEEIHFSGGLRGVRTNLGWALYPLSSDKDSDAVVFKAPQDHLDFAIGQCGVRYLGTCVKYMSHANRPSMDVWEFGARDPQSGLGAADSWAAIGHQAEKARDKQYAETTSYISAHLRAASLRLRDVSNGYHNQLSWALAENKAPGTWFSNTALDDLYADFHSLISEISSARDHIAMVAAIHVGAPGRIDSLSRLEDWVAKPVNRNHATHPMVRILLDALGAVPASGWLRRIGDLRNEMLHRVPMSANRSVAGLVLEQGQTSLGPVSKIRLAEPLSVTALSSQPIDPLVEISQLVGCFEMLCRAAWKHASESPRVS